MDATPLDWRPDSVFVQRGASSRDAREAGIGLRWALPWPSDPASADWRSALEVSVARWSTGVTPRGVPVAGRDHAVQWVVIPQVRWPLAKSAWFVQAGLGLSLHDRIYRVGRLRQASHLNFQQDLAWGRTLGGGHEVSLHLMHMSNAGLRKPNPGETWWSVRWGYAF
jgi:lipid A 3-O-deacylase